MNDKEFNLLDEPWILVIDDKCEIFEVSLIELFRNAHLYKDLRGELPTQDFAVMRLLLAILHTVFSRYDVNGEYAPLEDSDDALDRWQKIWESGKFPAEVITKYLESQRENFYLFHPERPFYQEPILKDIGKIPNGEYDSQKFIGTLSKSGHKDRLFASVGGEERFYQSNAQAARWLLNLNGFDDNACKSGAGIGWLGELGLIAVIGNNLFETLMLNFISYNVNSGEMWGEEKPVWEKQNHFIFDKVDDKVGTSIGTVNIVFPDNLSQLYTLQSRRILLIRSDKGVSGYKLLGGDYFSKESAFDEPMTVFRNSKDSIYPIPKSHDSSVQFWRDFSSITSKSDGKRCPGVISWVKSLFECANQILDKDYTIRLRIATIKYSGSQRSSVENVFSDSLQLHSSLISDMNIQWQSMVVRSVEFCDKIAQIVWSFAVDVNLSEGGDYVSKESNCSAKVFANKAKSQFYNRIDTPFREWLCMLNPETDVSQERETVWQYRCVDEARKLGEEIISQTASEAFFGRVKSSDNQKNVSAAKAFNIFIGRLISEERK